MSILRTIAMFIYLFGYMILHYGILRRAERAAAAGDTATVEQIVNQHIPRWSRGILKVTGVSLSVDGLENIPKDGPCVFVANHRSYYDIPLLLAGLEKPHGILAKEELEKIPLLNRWMKLLGCVFVQRDDVRSGTTVVYIAYDMKRVNGQTLNQIAHGYNKVIRALGRDYGADDDIDICVLIRLDRRFVQ